MDDIHKLGRSLLYTRFESYKTLESGQLIKVKKYVKLNRIRYFFLLKYYF